MIPHVSYSQYFLPNLMDMGSLLGTILGTILNYKRTLMSTVKEPLIRLILTAAHVDAGERWFYMCPNVG